MKVKAMISGMTVAAFLVLPLAMTTCWAATPQEKLLHSFGNGTDGLGPAAALIFDSEGNLYATTADGGIHGLGTAVVLSPGQGGSWSETIMHSFGRGTDGQSPLASLIEDGGGNFYGTTSNGGIHTNCADGCGTVFELSPQEGGGWTETVLHSFGGGNDGKEPMGELVMDSAGNLYGTTAFGGSHPCSGDGCGIVFELSRSQGGGWTETVLHNFGRSGDGEIPYSGLVFDSLGNLYGTTYYGGIHQAGTVFELSPNGSGGWSETVVHSLGNSATNDGANPTSSLIIDSNGNLYSTTAYGGIHLQGTVFELSPRQGGGWTEMVLHSFGNFITNDGQNPYAPLVMDGSGNLYGTTFMGGIHTQGIAFELSPAEDGGWSETVLHNFGATETDGEYPISGLILDSSGNLYGTTELGGTSPASGGTVFEITFTP